MDNDEFVMKTKKTIYDDFVVIQATENWTVIRPI